MSMMLPDEGSSRGFAIPPPKAAAGRGGPGGAAPVEENATIVREALLLEVFHIAQVLRVLQALVVLVRFPRPARVLRLLKAMISGAAEAIWLLICIELIFCW